jgi:hypothetical protein
VITYVDDLFTKLSLKADQESLISCYRESALSYTMTLLEKLTQEAAFFLALEDTSSDGTDDENQQMNKMLDKVLVTKKSE